MDYELEQLKDFIRSELKKGYAVETIKTTLASSGFPKAEIKRAFATLGTKTTTPRTQSMLVSTKPKRPGFFSGWFKHKPQTITPKKAKPVPKAKPKKPEKVKPKQPGFLSQFFFKEAEPIKKKIVKPKKIKVKPIKKKGPGLFAGWFKKKPKTSKTIIKEQPKPVIKPALKVKPKPVIPKGPGLSAGWFKHKPKKTVVQVKPKTMKPAPKPKGPGLFSQLFTRKPKTIKPTEVKSEPIQKPIIKPLPEPAPKILPKPTKPTGPGLFSRLFKPKSIKPVQQKVIANPIIKPKPQIIIKKIRGPSPLKPIGDFFKLFGKLIAVIIYKLTHPRKPAPITKKTKEKRMSHLSPPFLAFYLIMFFVVIGLIVYFFPATCITEECFVGKANKCEAATFRNVIGGTTLAYETNNCFIIKKVEHMSEEEPKIMQERFLGKSMTCSYKEGDFDPLYINTISAHLDTCKGELREEILKVIL